MPSSSLSKWPKCVLLVNLPSLLSIRKCRGSGCSVEYHVHLLRLHLTANWNCLVCGSFFFFFFFSHLPTWPWVFRVIFSCFISPVCLNHWPLIWLRFVHIRIHRPPTTALNYQYPDCAVYRQIHSTEEADGFVNCMFFLSVLPSRLGSTIFSKLHAITTQFTWKAKRGLVFVVWVFF